MKVGTKLFVCQNCNVGTMVKPNELHVVVCCENCGIERLIYEPVYSSKRFKWVLSKGNSPKTTIEPPAVPQAPEPLDGLAPLARNGGSAPPSAPVAPVNLQPPTRP